MIQRLCQAEEFGDRVICGRCAQEWPRGTAPAEIPPCRDQASPSIGLAEMADTMLVEAREVTTGQAALVAAGIRARPWLPALRKAAVMRAIAALIERVRGDEMIVKRLKETV